MGALALALVWLSAATASVIPRQSSPLEVQKAPSYVRPYVIRQYAPASAVTVGQQVYRFPVTGPSSGGAFSVVLTTAPSSGDLGVLPHMHQAHYENFFCGKGRFQLWAEKDGFSEARLLTPGDYGAVPHNTTHTFQVLDPFTTMIGNIVPGGFENLFFAIADGNYSSSTWSPYVPSNASAGSSSGAGGSASLITALESFDVYAQLDFVPRRDLVNGSAPSTSTWHTGDNELSSDGETPFFVAKDYGPKYLNSVHLGYQIVQPFVTPTQSGDFTFSEGTISMSRAPVNETVRSNVFKAAQAFTVLEGQLSVNIGQEPAVLNDGDTVFIPGNTPFQYWSTVAFTKILYTTGNSSDTLDKMLMDAAENWDYPTFPTFW